MFRLQLLLLFFAVSSFYSAFGRESFVPELFDEDVNSIQDYVYLDDNTNDNEEDEDEVSN